MNEHVLVVLLALSSAAAYGLSDFVGGTVSRRASAWRVAVVTQGSATICAAVAALVTGGTPSGTDLAWAAVAGVGSGTGVGFLFRGMAAGRMSVVAPLSAVGAALVPVFVGLVLGERPGLLAAVGILVAFPGIWLVAASPGPEQAADPSSSSHPPRARSASGVVDGVLAGVGFGAAFVALSRVSEAAGLWSVGAAQLVSTGAAAALATALGASWIPDAAALRAAPAGLLGALALTCYQLSSHHGLLTVAAVLASLYPAVTILLAVVVLHERVHRLQAVGLVLCGLTVAAVAAG